jgi:hypothetical protein
LSTQAASASPLVPLNAFQRLARAWERVHPYNAAQVLRVRGPLDLPALERAWAAALEGTGLGRVRMVGEAFRHESLNGELMRYPVRVRPAGASLEAHLSAELNRPFGDPGEPPFRPFVAPSADGYSFGVVYQHWVADSVAIRLLLREWFRRLYDAGRGTARPLRHSAAGYWRLFGPGRGGWRPVEVAMSLFRRHMRYRRARKVRTFGEQDYPVRVLLREAPEGLVQRLYAWARDAGVKLNDVFLAAAAESCQRLVPVQHRRNRRDVAVGSIVDLRPYAGTDLDDTFGLFLGFTEVVCRPPELCDFAKLVRSVAMQNRRHRQLGIGQSSLGWMIAAVAAGRFVPGERLYHFFRKEAPLLAGVSNVNLNRTWAAEYHPQLITDYLRVSPTGPLAPLVFTLTTLGPRLTLSLTYRPALLDEQMASQLATIFLARLASVVALPGSKE